jgi:hypothetical protein
MKIFQNNQQFSPSLAGDGIIELNGNNTIPNRL